MNYKVRRKLAPLILAFLSSQIWYYVMVDVLCDTSIYPVLYPLAHILQIALPFICCFIWSDFAKHRRYAFLISYFFVLPAGDCLQAVIYNIYHVCYEPGIITYFTGKNIIMAFMIILRVIVSVRFMYWLGHNTFILVSFKNQKERKELRKKSAHEQE